MAPPTDAVPPDGRAAAEHPDSGGDLGHATGTVDLAAALPAIALETVRLRLAGRPLRARDLPVPPEADAPALWSPAATFVTLERRGRLRGCIGSLAARRPLYMDVARNAERSMTDPRLPPVTGEDWPELTVKVSVLSPAEPFEVADEADLVAALRPGVDGLTLFDDSRRATFLPSVWAKLPDPARFAAALLRKGGWPEWPAGGLLAERYTSAEYVSAPPEGGRA